ncbi:MAG: hypothetical protein EOO16_05555 [Chitinophagaceae bacterium]|nr:MAG: hypothetical protein EOO16_05555 [Chitinophagaceae bacterium]
MKRHLTAAIAALLLLNACGKPEIIGPDNTDPAAPGMLLDKIVETTNGTSTVINFEYDLRNGLTSYASEDNRRVAHFDYDEGRLYLVEEMDGRFQVQYFYEFNNGKPVSAQYKRWRLDTLNGLLVDDETFTYTLQGDQVTGIRVRNVANGAQQEYSLSYDDRGELTAIRSVGSNNYEAQFVHGSHRSAYPFITRWVLDPYGYSARFHARHELLSANYDFPGTSMDKFQSNSYTFNPLGYPVTASSGNVQSLFFYQ